MDSMERGHYPAPLEEAARAHPADPQTTKEETMSTVNETIEIDASADGVTVADYPGMNASDKGATLSPSGRESDNLTVFVIPDGADQRVNLAVHLIVDHADERIEVAGYLSIDDADDARRIARAILSAFPDEG